MQMVGEEFNRFRSLTSQDMPSLGGGGMKFNYGIISQPDAVLDLNITTDQVLLMFASPVIIDKIIVYDVSTTLAASLAAGGIYTAASKGGSAVVAAGQVYTALTSSIKFLALTQALPNDLRSEANLYFSLTVAHGAPATAKIVIFGWKVGS